MTLAQLRRHLEENAVRRDAYSLEGGRPSEAYCIETSPDGYVVYYSERGVRTSLQRFDTEAEACARLLDLLRRDGLLHD